MFAKLQALTLVITILFYSEISFSFTEEYDKWKAVYFTCSREEAIKLLQNPQFNRNSIIASKKASDICTFKLGSPPQRLYDFEEVFFKKLSKIDPKYRQGAKTYNFIRELKNLIRNEPLSNKTHILNKAQKIYSTNLCQDINMSYCKPSLYIGLISNLIDSYQDVLK
ncbi:hypothetical protein [Agarilytica rhodophyticola]|uniref:hypothetical protein n=1 Tax=Agarilytica rhodophyticola TaxID=1737490 RepID=UPI000B345657|nr:hypothetical protein [Agarilytica rhodophyticola]